jgi:phosphate transport system substrate-binding protein
MKTTWSRAIALSSGAVIAGLGMTGAAQAQSRDYISIVGSSTVFPFSTAVAEEFANTSSFPAPVIESTGTGGGFSLFCAGAGVDSPDISNASRAIKDSEIEACAANGVTEITEVLIGYDGIVVANSNTADSYSLTRGQIWAALAKTVPVDGALVDNPHMFWSDIDPSLPPHAIEVLGPPPTSGTRDAFVELVMLEGCEEFPEVAALADEEKEAVCSTMREDGLYVEAGENDNLIVQKLQANPNALGVFGFSFLDQNSDTLQGSSVDGVAPTFEAIADGSYPVSRSLFFYVKNAHVGVIPGIQEFVTEFTDEAAFGPDGYLGDLGLIPLPDDVRTEVATSAQALTPMTN